MTRISEKSVSLSLESMLKILGMVVTLAIPFSAWLTSIHSDVQVLKSEITSLKTDVQDIKKAVESRNKLAQIVDKAN